jgi:signal transduction histidine kinase
MESTAAALGRKSQPESKGADDERREKFLVLRSDALAARHTPAGACRSHLHDLLEKEAKRMAQSLHDEAGQLLALVYLKLDDLTSRVPETQLGSLGELRSMLSRLESELRRLSHELRPMILDDFGLLPALEFLRQGVTGRTGIAITIDGNVCGRLANSVETALYRIVYEALRIAVQGHARNVQITLRRDDRRVICAIRQEGGDGTGQVGALKAIRQRIEDLSGTLLTCDGPDRSVAMVVRMPVD